MGCNNSFNHVKPHGRDQAHGHGAAMPCASLRTTSPRIHWSSMVRYGLAPLKCLSAFWISLENENPAAQPRVGCQGSQSTAPKCHVSESAHV